jgi:immune inhibitor A
MCLHKEVVVGKGGSARVETVAACAPARDQLAVFDDTDPLAYWSDVNPQNSVQVAGAGVTAEVVGQDGDYLVVEVTNPAG